MRSGSSSTRVATSRSRSAWCCAVLRGCAPRTRRERCCVVLRGNAAAWCCEHSCSARGRVRTQGTLLRGAARVRTAHPLLNATAQCAHVLAVCARVRTEGTQLRCSRCAQGAHPENVVGARCHSCKYNHSGLSSIRRCVLSFSSSLCVLPIPFSPFSPSSLEHTHSLSVSLFIPSSLSMSLSVPHVSL